MTLEQQMVAAVRKHALEHYNEDGWDYVVECWSDEDIVDQIDLYGTEENAIEMVEEVVKVLDDRRKDVMAEIF